MRSLRGAGRWARLMIGTLAIALLATLVSVANPQPAHAAPPAPTAITTTERTVPMVQAYLPAQAPSSPVAYGLREGAGELLAKGCGVLGPVCDVAGDVVGNVTGNLPGVGGLPGLPGIPGVGSVGDLFGGGIPGLGDIPNPFEAIGDVIAKAAADAWTAAMLAVWNSGLFVLRIVLTFSELFLTPDLRADGPGNDVYAFALWLALALAVILAMIQFGAAAFKREGKGLARAFIGAGQFAIVNACWFGYAVTLIAACGAITRALMKSLLSVQTWPEWDPLGGLGVDDITEAGVATALAFLGIFLWLAAIGHLLVYLARAASLLVLTATGPLSAAGLLSEFTRSWFWKSLRWFHAAAFTPVLMVMVLGIGVQFANGVAASLAEDSAKAFGTALPAVMTILISVVAPLSLFKLLAFVDPGTPSGASFRQGMAIQGGLQGLLGGGSGGGSSTASATDTNGVSSGEQGAEGTTGDRFNKSTQGALGSLGGAGQALSAGMGWINSAGAKATSLMSDETNQAGVGQGTYGPDFSGLGGRQPSSQSGGTHPGSQSDSPDDDSSSSSSSSSSLASPMPPTPPTLPVGGGGAAGSGGAASNPASATGGAGGGAGGAAGGGAGGAASGAGAAAGGIPPVV